MENISTRLMTEFKYDSEEERSVHVTLMEAQGYECSGQLRRCDEPLTKPDRQHYWYGHFTKRLDVPVVKTEPSEAVKTFAYNLSLSGYGSEYEDIVEILSKLSDSDIDSLAYNCYRTAEKISMDAFDHERKYVYS